MRNWKILGLVMAALVLAQVPSVRAQMSEEEKKRLFLRAREDIRPVPRPAASATPRPRPRTATPPPVSKPSPTAAPRPTSRPRATPEGTPDIIELEPPPPPPRSGSKPTPARREPSPKATPKPTPPQIPRGRTPAGERLDAPIVIEKSGLIESEGEVPAPKSTGGWFRRWRYLTPSVRRAIDKARVKKGRWKYIIIHNSGTRQGNARIFGNYHKRVRKMQNGLAYHFVIGNGTSSGDGEIEIGPRWPQQLNGGHVASDYLNNIAIGVCFVGDFNRDQITPAQMAALDELIVYLRGRVGKIKGKPAIVVPHKNINPKPTDCPGKKFPYQTLKKKYG